MVREEELTIERATLTRAVRDIVAGERRVTEQEFIVCELEGRGQSTLSATALLRTLRDTLEEWHAHHREIIARIAYLEAEEAAASAAAGPAPRAS